MRIGIVPLAGIGVNLAFGFLAIGMLIGAFSLVKIGIALFSLVVIFQLVNLPVEFDASARAKVALVSNRIILPAEEPYVAKVLNAAALTYVAATITAILQLLYFLYRSGLLGGRRE